MTPPLKTAGLTHVGHVRTSNQDAWLVRHLGQTTLLVVADGMGGHAGGEEASRIAVHHVESTVVDGESADGGRLGDALRGANDEIRSRAAAAPDLLGMGTTCIAVVVDGVTARWAHVGDSRLYLHRQGEITPLTRDHSRVQQMLDQGILSADEARTHPYRHVITQALGALPAVDVDEAERDLADGELLLLCSDGLTGMLTDDEIRRILDDTPDVREASQALVNAALDAGGDDNVTVVLARPG